MNSNIINKKFNSLFVVEKTTDKKNGSYLYKCICDCGNITYETSARIKNGSKKSCGCLKNVSIKNLIDKTTKHGKCNHRLYKIFIGMKERCHNKNNKSYNKYGGRGISISKDWLVDFMNFYNWSMDNGYEENLTIDRINNNGNYEPSNCRWVDMKAQANNRSNNKHIEYEGCKYTYSEFEDKFKINQNYLSENIIKGYSIDDIILMNKCFMKSEFIKLSKITVSEFNKREKNGYIIPSFITKTGKRMYELR